MQILSNNNNLNKVSINAAPAVLRSERAMSVPENSYGTDKLNAFDKAPNQKVFAGNLASLGVNFKGQKTDSDKSLEDLRNEYEWYVNVDKTTPLDAFLKIRTDEKAMNELFVDILQDDELSYKLIDDIAGKAREARGNYATLKKLLGEDSENLRFFLFQNPYGKAFEKYMTKRYEDAKSLEPLLKLRPDWREGALVKKYEELNGNSNLKIGNIPDEFKNGVFEQLYDYLSIFCQYQGYKTQETIPSLTIGNKTYNFEYFTQGKTDKNVFGVYTPEKKYVFKIADPSKKSLNKPFSLGALALIDRYLTLNNCHNIAPIYYYDHDKNVCIYKYQDHNLVHHKFSSPSEVNNYMPDFKSLGMCYNDTLGNDNYFLSDIDCKSAPYDTNMGKRLTKELISVDNDHVTFSSPFMLLVTQYNCPLPNAMQTAF